MTQTCPCPLGHPGMWGRGRKEIVHVEGLCVPGVMYQADPAYAQVSKSCPAICRLQSTELCGETPSLRCMDYSGVSRGCWAGCQMGKGGWL